MNNPRNTQSNFLNSRVISNCLVMAVFGVLRYSSREGFYAKFNITVMRYFATRIISHQGFSTHVTSAISVPERRYMYVNSLVTSIRATFTRTHAPDVYGRA